MDVTYEEFAELNHFLNSTPNLPPAIEDLNTRLTAYFAQQVKTITPEMEQAAEEQETKATPDEQAAYIANPTDDTEDMPAEAQAVVAAEEASA